ncbi:MAG: type II secretion system F family protein [Alphaproteobacteria bacterium]|nr:type II secretion system F family protein [Alphaproteobacteria bacterium]
MDQLSGDDALTMIVLLSLAATTVAVAIVLALGPLLDQDRLRARQRLAKMKNRAAVTNAGNAAAAQSIVLRSDDRYVSIESLDRLLKRILPSQKKLSERLIRTGKNITVRRYLAICAIVALAAMVLTYQFLPVPPAAVPLLGVFAGLMLPHYVIGRIIKRRQGVFLDEVPEAIDLLVRGLRSGLPVGESIGAVGNEMGAPVGPEFRKLFEAIAIGQTWDEALNAMVKRVGVAEIQFFAIALSIQRETGGNLAETLENLSDILRRRRQMKLKIKALSAEAMASAWIVGLLPFLLGLATYFMNRDYIMMLWIDETGNMVALVGLGLMAAGIAMMMRLINFDV